MSCGTFQVPFAEPRQSWSPKCPAPSPAKPAALCQVHIFAMFLVQGGTAVWGGGTTSQQTLPVLPAIMGYFAFIIWSLIVRIEVPLASQIPRNLNVFCTSARQEKWDSHHC